MEESVIRKAIDYEMNGADELFLYNYSGVGSELDEFLELVKHVVKVIDIPVLIGCCIHRCEDIKDRKSVV